MILKISIKDFLLVFLSVVLLILSYPIFNFSFLAWGAFVPLMFVLDQKTVKSAYGIGFWAGFMFFIGTLYWFIHVTLPGLILLMVYLAQYFALFAVGYSWVCRKSLPYKLFFLPSFWVILEFLRRDLFSGFGWVSLGHSQYENLLVIQIADITGVAGISFLVMMVNVLVKELIAAKIYKNSDNNQNILPATISVMVIFLIVLGYGGYRLNQQYPAQKAKIAVIQGNIPQSLKWEDRFAPEILLKHMTITKQAALEKPELILWPETSFPGYLWDSPQLFEELKDFVREVKIPIVVGVVTRIAEDYYNSAFLLSSEGEVIKQYDKLHLVPFGEYIPLRKYISFIADMIPIGDFTTGKKFTLFPVIPMDSIENPQWPFAVLICFEDTVPHLSRQFVKEGAGLLVNITNDAWFEDTNAPFLHLQAAVFRAVENRKFLLRSANTGVSGFVNPYGKIIRTVQDTKGKKTYVPGYAIEEVSLNNIKTFYTQYGDIFVYICLGFVLISLIIKKK